MSIQTRLNRIEAQRAEVGTLGIRLFQESTDTAGVFYELPGAFYAGQQPYSRGDIRGLCRDGWTCIVVLYYAHEGPQDEPT